MTIEHNIPSNILRPGNFSQIELNSPIQGLAVLDKPITLVGVKLSGGTASNDTEYRINDVGHAETLFGVGSELALMARIAFQAMRLESLFVPLYGLAIADPGGTAAIHKFTVGAFTATVAGTITFSVGRKRGLTANVSVGDDQDAVVLAMKAAIDAVADELPCTAAVNGVNANELDLTLRYTGVNGSDLLITVDDVGNTGFTITPSEDVAGVGAAAYSTALATIVTEKRHVVAFANHVAQDVTDGDTHLNATWADDQAGWRFVVMAEDGAVSVGNALAPNDHRMLVLCCEGSPALPCEVAAAAAVEMAGRTKPNRNYNGTVLHGCPAPAKSLRFTTTERETALAGGTTPLVVNRDGDLTIDRLVTTKITDGGNPFDAVRDYGTINTIVYMAKQADILFTSSKYKGKNKSKRVRKQMRSDVLVLHREAEELEYIEAVDALKDQLVVEPDASVDTRAVLNQPVRPVPILNQTVAKTVLFTKVAAA